MSSEHTLSFSTADLGLRLSMTILRICVYGFYINKNAELYLLTKSPKCDHIYKLCLHMLEENNC